MKRQTKTLQKKVSDAWYECPQFQSIVAHYHKIIAITDIVASFKFALHELVPARSDIRS